MVVNNANNVLAILFNLENGFELSININQKKHTILQRIILVYLRLSAYSAEKVHSANKIRLNVCNVHGTTKICSFFDIHN